LKNQKKSTEKDITTLKKLIAKEKENLAPIRPMYTPLNSIPGNHLRKKTYLETEKQVTKDAHLNKMDSIKQAIEDTNNNRNIAKQDHDNTHAAMVNKYGMLNVLIGNIPPADKRVLKKAKTNIADAELRHNEAKAKKSAEEKLHGTRLAYIDKHLNDLKRTDPKSFMNKAKVYLGMKPATLAVKPKHASVSPTKGSTILRHNPFHTKQAHSTANPSADSTANPSADEILRNYQEDLIQKLGDRMEKTEDHLLQKIVDVTYDHLNKNPTPIVITVSDQIPKALGNLSEPSVTILLCDLLKSNRTIFEQSITDAFTTMKKDKPTFSSSDPMFVAKFREIFREKLNKYVIPR